jgi:N5-(cytidine 5'-diphosphoramidyl)-L-glutamine hydrolase
MKIAITQRIDFIENRNEFRDSIDQALIKLIISIGYSPLLIPNSLIQDVDTDILEKWLIEHKPEGILISGGNDIGQYPLRDNTEEYLYHWAVKMNLPVLGICRGMQIIGLIHGSILKKVNGHVSARHTVLNLSNNKESTKNSYHSFSLSDCPKDFQVTYISNDGEIEAIKHNKKSIFGIMWHPERENIFLKEDINFIKSIYG